ncbi:Peptidyl-prolyl cis-trans isomerase CYP57 [Spatholobus suberectus]|nr:Peptidyl-prolyl cis-trans isomerase CYP57 [Spatholobus suberectus]
MELWVRDTNCGGFKGPYCGISLKLHEEEHVDRMGFILKVSAINTKHIKVDKEMLCRLFKLGRVGWKKKSIVYVLEPLTKGKVVVNTTREPLDIELWSKQAPKAMRNFVQLCLENYYDNTIFHYIIKGFLIQGGDPTRIDTGMSYEL